MISFSTIPQHNENLWEHQVQAKDQILKGWDSYDSLMLQMPTGTGKTFLFTSLVNDLVSFYKANHLEINILLVVHRLELLDQISGSLNRFGISHGFIQGSREQHLWKRIQVASIQSILTEKNEMNVMRLDFDFIIVDEAHHSLSDTYKRLFEAFPKAKKLGVTATPWRFNHESFTSIYQKLITTPQISWFIKNHILSDFDYVSIKPESEVQHMVDNTEIADTGDFVNKELDNAFNNQRIRAKLFESYLKFAKGRKGIIYAINRQHAQNLVDLYCAQGVKAVAIDCETPKMERQYLIEQFKEGNIQVLVNVEIFTEGFDCPDVSFIQLARPTRSLALYLQQVGRGLRRSKGKDKTIILDNVGLYNYFGLPDANRHWHYHFLGHETPDDNPERNGGLREVESDNMRERKYDEEDEEMMVVRGSTYSVHTEAADDMTMHEPDPIQPIEFQLCDYYLVHGIPDSFHVFPLTKKRGKVTGGVGNAIYTYNAKSLSINFGSDIAENLQILDANPKVKTIIGFCAALSSCSIRDFMNIQHLSAMAGITSSRALSLWETLRMISKVK